MNGFRFKFKLTLPHTTALLGLGLLVLASSGCQPSDEGRYRFSGTVTYRGEPVPIGSIMLEPDSSKGNSGPAGSAAITDGKFDSSAHDSGFVGGPHVVTIQGFSGENPDPDFAPHGAPIGGGRSFIQRLDLPTEDVELNFEMADLVD